MFKSFCVALCSIACTYVAADTSNMGTCYDPMHSDLYPLPTDSDTAAKAKISSIFDADFLQLSQQFKHIRTYASQYYGVDIAPVAAKYNLSLVLGLQEFPANPSWTEAQNAAAVRAVQSYPNAVTAIIIGNENLQDCGGQKSPYDIVKQIDSMKSRLSLVGIRNIPVGTVQRLSSWLNPDAASGMDALAGVSDVIGANIYPFFTQGYNPVRPTEQLEAQWRLLQNRYPGKKSKLCLTETGYPSAGNNYLDNIPSDSNQLSYFAAFKQWEAPGTSFPKFWFMAYDRKHVASINSPSYEQFFGVYDAAARVKYALVKAP